MQSPLKLKNPGMFSDRDLKNLIIPLLLDQFLAVAVGLVDTVMVASCGEAVVSAVSLVDSINVLIIAVVAALATGGAVVIAQYIGSRDIPQACSAAKQLFYTVSILTVLIAALAILFNGSLLRLIFGVVEPAVMESAMPYFFWTALSYPFIAAVNVGGAAFRAQGNSRVSLYVSLVMNILNVIGNATLIFGFHMGATGAAISTCFARVVAAVFVTVLLCQPKQPVYIRRLYKPELRFSMIKRILGVGIPSGLENGMFQLGRLLLQRLTATFGTAVIAANAVYSSIANVANLAGASISLAMITVVGQCMGAGKTEEANMYAKHLLKLSYIFAGMLYLLFALLAEPLVACFSLSGEAATLAVKLVRLFVLVAMVFWPASFVLPGALRAAGDVKFTMVVAMLSMCIFRIAFGYILGGYFSLGIYGIQIAMFIDWIVRVSSFTLRFRQGKWKNIHVI